MHKPLLFLSSVTWVLFIFILWAAFDSNPFIIIGLGVIPLGLFIAAIVIMMKRAIS